MRIGEVVVFGTSNPEIEIFIRAICDQVAQKDDAFFFGDLSVNEQLTLYLYGVSIENEIRNMAWDLFSPKVLGYIVLFDWFKKQEIEKIQELLNHIKENGDTPLILAGTVNGDEYPVPETIFTGGIPLTLSEKLLFCRINEPETCRKAMISLLDIVLDHVS
jgi:hypothetical protein